MSAPRSVELHHPQVLALGDLVTEVGVRQRDHASAPAAAFQHHANISTYFLVHASMSEHHPSVPAWPHSF
eukprot:1139636-Pelagomonas_calceolata.AAC.2